MKMSIALVAGGTIAIAELAKWVAISLGIVAAGAAAYYTTDELIDKIKQETGQDLRDKEVQNYWAPEKEVVETLPKVEQNYTANQRAAMANGGIKQWTEQNQHTNPHPNIPEPTQRIEQDGTTTLQPGGIGGSFDYNTGQNISGNITTGPGGIAIGGGGIAIGGSAAGEHEGNPAIPNIDTNTNTGNKGEDQMEDKIPNIEDKTNENIENAIPSLGTIDEWIKYAEANQKEQWAREDKIRKETQEREDNAYQRMVADMKKAGINPNLVNISGSGSDSGGGITQATAKDMSAINKMLETKSNELVAFLEREFEGDENTKKQLTNLFSEVLSSVMMFFTFKK